MGIHNRTLGLSEQYHPLPFAQQMTITSGDTGVLAFVPYPCALQVAQVAAFSIESNAYLLFTVNRFIPGSGFTSYFLGSSFVPATYGTSGVLPAGVSLPVVGNTLLNLMPGDVLGYQAGGGSTSGIFGLAGAFVVKPAQDVRTYLGGLA